jgi:hypothetical protein
VRDDGIWNGFAEAPPNVPCCRGPRGEGVHGGSRGSVDEKRMSMHAVGKAGEVLEQQQR